ncbi:MAG: nitrous oxide-stimulated promoter family protein [Atopobiaceae bacterium]|nr:nitrous oxide-stimulated promoter family protein [Atopobiaceae bacterium]
MIALYCRGNHGTPRGVLCPECAELAEYAAKRTARCPFMATKTFCSQCKVHCYAPVQREKIRQVMRYAGPRLMLSHPLMTIHHGIDTLGAKLRAR